MKTSDWRIVSASVAGAVFCLAANQAHADENLFGYTYTADVLPKGKWEVEQWATGRIGKQSGDFLGTDLRTEIETGLTDRLQASLYLNYNYFYVHNAITSDGPIGNKNFLGVSGSKCGSRWALIFNKKRVAQNE